LNTHFKPMARCPLGRSTKVQVLFSSIEAVAKKMDYNKGRKKRIRRRSIQTQYNKNRV